MAIIAYLDIDQGSDFNTIMELETDQSTPIDLTQCQVYSQFRKSYGSTTAYTFDASIIDAPGGKLKLSLSGEVSSSIRPGRYLYDVEIVSSVSKTRVVEGILTINPEITKIP